MPVKTTPSKDPSPLLKALQAFAEELTAKFTVSEVGEPEDQLRPAVDRLFRAYADAIARTNLLLKGEVPLHDRLGQPDFCLYVGPLPIGFVELKAPGKGANPSLYKAHDKEQWERFRAVPNILYTDGNEWALYHDGELTGRRLRLAGDIRTDARRAVEPADARSLDEILRAFTAWSPLLPDKPADVAAFLAPFCRMIRDEVLEALADPASPLQTLKEEIKTLLFPEASDFQFADAYAQTVVFALLLARAEGADALDLHSCFAVLESGHLMLSRVLQSLTDTAVLKEIGASLALLQRVVHAIPPGLLAPVPAGEDDPWLYFYENFLTAYDPDLRKKWGVFYTPVEVVRCQVTLIQELLVKRLGKTRGFVDEGVLTLDPTLGTATYLLGIVDRALDRVRREDGPGAVPGAATALGNNLHGFEWMVGPYAVAQLRLSRAIVGAGGTLPPDGPGIYLTNTLESPHTIPPSPTMFNTPIAREHKRALKVKDQSRVLVCLGNPPYGRHEAERDDNHAVTGGWVRYGDDGMPKILEDFIKPVQDAGKGVHLKNLYNLYVYFLRWAFWKVFEHASAPGPGVVSFITASSYIEGDAFLGLRRHLRRLCDEIYILDLGGEGRGTRKEENVFAIQTPVAILVAWRKGPKSQDKPAVVRYTKLEGSRDEKLKALNSVKGFKNLPWEEAPSDWDAPFKPVAQGGFADWPDITDLFPWQSNGVQVKRSWPIGPEQEVIKARWAKMLHQDDRAECMRESGDRTVALAQSDIFNLAKTLPAIQTLLKNHPAHTIVRYGFRSFDRQYLLADSRLISRPRPALWHSDGNSQVYLSTLSTTPLSIGPALVASHLIPDMHHFRGSFGSKDIIPLYRDAEARQPNLLPGLLDLLGEEYGKKVSPEDFAAYVYALLAQPSYTQRFEKELGDRKVRVPLTRDPELFFQAAAQGRRLLNLHTYGDRFAEDSAASERRPTGSAVGRVSDPARPRHPDQREGSPSPRTPAPDYHPDPELASGEGSQQTSSSRSPPSFLIHNSSFILPSGSAKCTKSIPEGEDAYPNEYSYNAPTKILKVGAGEFKPVEPDVYNFQVSGLKVVQSWLGYRMRNRSGKKSSPLDDIRPKSWTDTFTHELLQLLWVLESTINGYPAQEKLLDAVLKAPLFATFDLPAVPDPLREPPKGLHSKGLQGTPQGTASAEDVS